MRRRTVSIEDIAQAAGVSHSTVSRALRDSPLISADVRAHIQRLAGEMGYTPNAIAQSLQMQRTNTVGLVVTSIDDPFLADIVKGVEAVARAAHLGVFLSASHHDPDQEIAVIETFHRRRVDGLLIESSLASSAYAERLARLGVPTVLINSQSESTAHMMHTVGVDDYSGARMAVEHLLGLGHRAIGYLGVGNRPRSNAMRFAGYRDTLLAAGAPFRDSAVVLPELGASQLDDVAVGQALLPRLLDAQVTAVFCYNDMLAIGALLACRARGIAVPADLSVVGFDDVQLAQFMVPTLTTVHQPKVELGELAMQNLLALLAERPVDDAVLQPSLVVRASTAPPAR
jgi:LacI family transcriptional regulator/LacI family repressor for deo operon, udp, cdd, tsx, nupC, and nupG